MEVASKTLNSPRKQRFGHILTSICYLLTSDTQDSNIGTVSSFIGCYRKYIDRKSLYRRLTKSTDKIDLSLILRFIRIWVYLAFYKDFYVSKSLHRLITYLGSLSKTRKDLVFEINKIKLALINRYHLIRPLNNRVKPPSILIKGQPVVSLFSFSPKEVADQLLLIESELFSNLNLSEFVSTEDKPNLNILVDRANRISLWVASNILTQKSTKNQIRVIRYFLSILYFCEALGNYNSVFNIMGGFHLNYISRLSKIWLPEMDNNSRILLSKFRSITDPSNNYKSYREIFNKRYSLLETGVPTIPVIGLLTRDIALIEEANKDYLDEKINRDKLDLLMRLFEKIYKFQTCRYVLSTDRNSNLSFHLINLHKLADDKLATRSEQIRPRENTEGSTSDSDSNYLETNSDISINAPADDLSGSDLVDVSISSLSLVK